MGGQFSAPLSQGPWMQADKQDYLLRDSRFCGVEYGVFDIFSFIAPLSWQGQRTRATASKWGFFIR